MPVESNVSLRSFNSFGIEVTANRFARFNSLDELRTHLSMFHASSPIVLGGGSNVLFVKDRVEVVLRNEVKGFQEMNRDDEFLFIRAGAGENWHQFVMRCIDLGVGGAENLALIPGSVGASPMQNIGAYGVELKDIFHSLTAVDKQTLDVKEFTLDDCQFGYRESTFKHHLSDRFIIVDVTFRLRRTPILNTSYGAIEEELSRMNVHRPSVAAIAQAVMNIRRSKLPDPAIIGNAGSFFKNPTVSQEKADELRKMYEKMPAYPNADGSVKLAAGWMIEECGWKGYRRGEIGCHERQALVLVNFGNAKGADVLELSTEIMQSVMEKFGVALEREVNIIGA
jgi:UDP-N-acetylmuramate dehydrogenase